ncbi:hypothetical protein Sru01_03410 [Sphaerisporangium rufum]|uniref:Hydrolase of the HAD superfamily n=1 Tax=Sphaerisporangium rufum TaxID=1381558 RepID=A0A919UX09_9ACTN|nr:HAD family phosphatase [Sphaerisporangium rufum]GII75359.1 hypothetical protein Sru01_03410 [Sphaerisporangium rufum]
MLRGLLIDWGGVLTVGLREAIAEWIAADGIDDAHYTELMRELVREAYDGDGRSENIIHALERGEIDPVAFERDLAARLLTRDGAPPAAEGLLSRMFAGFRPVEPMWEMLRAVREAGIATCLVSNSWGDHYTRDGWEAYFDQVVISGEVGMRKPEPRIFHHAADLVRLGPQECLFVDDVPANIVAARALGMTGLHHLDPDETIIEIGALLEVPLRPVAPGR